MGDHHNVPVQLNKVFFRVCLFVFLVVEACKSLINLLIPPFSIVITDDYWGVRSYFPFLFLLLLHKFFFFFGFVFYCCLSLKSLESILIYILAVYGEQTNNDEQSRCQWIQQAPVKMCCQTLCQSRMPRQPANQPSVRLTHRTMHIDDYKLLCCLLQILMLFLCCCFCG